MWDFSSSFSDGSHGQESAGNTGYLDSIPGWRRSPGEGNDCPLQYSLENSKDRGAWWATVHRAAESDMTEKLALHFHIVLAKENEIRDSFVLRIIVLYNNI